MRDFFMAPQNPFRVKEALISLLAGDIFGETPIRHAIFALKALYFLVSLFHPRRSWAFWKRRRFNIRDAEVPASDRPGGRAEPSAIMVLLPASLGLPAQAEELPLPGPSIEGPVYKAGYPAAPADAGEKPFWEHRHGGGRSALSRLSRLGPDELLCAAAALLRLSRRAAARRQRRRAGDPIRRQRVTVDISISASVPTRSQHNDARQGMPDLAGTFEIGPNLNVELWHSADRRVKFEFRMPLRQAITLQSHPNSAGLTLSPNINADVRDFIGGLKLGVLIGPLFGNQRQHQYFYGVAPEFATPERPAYDAPGGYSGWRAIAALSRRFGNLYIGGFVRHDDLRGANFAASPLVRSDHAFTAGFGMSWIFAASNERVVADD